ncbi:hypothetical protein IOC61_01125 [Halomonas sp. KAO]|nr:MULTISPECIES: hypothetical protein [unclassified Halomonas]MBF7051919.1 hypothetical protein [Halomonas sp. KAO]MDT0501361.1 hypothetical protein [Halomonas sp. PAR7]MDT0512115.1 hypothetical protein [Halomonas sp. LES1]MDT0590748.1 hypothetical protein [Halomonas sp. PAR8]
MLLKPLCFAERNPFSWEAAVIKTALLLTGVLGVAWMPAIAVAGNETD